VSPPRAAEQAREILRAVPGEPRASFLLGAALRRSGDAKAALKTLDPIAASQPDAAHAHLERGLALAALGRDNDAIAAFERALQIKPDLSDAWLGIAERHAAAGRSEAADNAYAQSIRAATRDPRLLEAGAALIDNRLAVAEALLREHLKAKPTDAAAIRMLGEVAARLGRFGDAETLLRRALELTPNFDAARHNLALILHRANKSADALEEIERLGARDAANPNYRNLKAAILARLGEYNGAIALYERLLQELPDFYRGWLSYGHALKTAGRRDDCIGAYRKSLTIEPRFGEAYWSLANLKTYRFSGADIAAMRAMLERGDLSEEDRLHFHYTLGKALEDSRDYEASFKHYAEGARLRHNTGDYDPEEITQAVARSRTVFTRAFYAERAGWGAQAADPIFIVGLPRAGSTLIEQMLSCHSAVEGTMELPEIGMMARALGGKKRRAQSSYPENALDLDAAAVRTLGEEYLERTQVYRRTGKPFFIDKMPNNWEYAGLIRLMLPNAKIIDARRHPMAGCFGAFKQHFARGQRFSYDLADLGRYYSDYVALMAHIDEVAPGAVHRVFYERMVRDTERQVRALLDYCGLPFEQTCLDFHQNDRAVRTASSEQVRQPIFTSAVEQWRNYEPWLGPLKAALGPCLDTYPEP
jgi:tetratricopeptide (TPR) repeat protein